MEMVSFRVPDRRGDEPFLLMPVGDIQWAGDEQEVALTMLQKHIKWGVEHGAYFIGMGDYIDFASPSNRERLTQAALYDTSKSVINRTAFGLAEEIFAKALKPSRGRWLGLLEGHHYFEGVNRGGKTTETTDQYLSHLLGTPFLGTSAYVRLQFRRSAGASGSGGSVLVWAHHGQGGGTARGAALNKLFPKLSEFEADIYLLGHFTSKDAQPLDYIVPVFGNGQPVTVHRTKLLVATGGFSKSYMPGRKQGTVPRGGYVEQGMMRPAALGGPLVKIRPRWKRVAGRTVWVPDLNVEL